MVFIAENSSRKAVNAVCVGKKAAYLIVLIFVCNCSFLIGKGNTDTADSTFVAVNADDCSVTAVIGKVIYGVRSVGKNVVYTQTVSTVGVCEKFLITRVLLSGVEMLSIWLKSL